MKKQVATACSVLNFQHIVKTILVKCHNSPVAAQETLPFQYLQKPKWESICSDEDLNREHKFTLQISEWVWFTLTLNINAVKVPIKHKQPDHKV